MHRPVLRLLANFAIAALSLSAVQSKPVEPPAPTAQLQQPELSRPAPQSKPAAKVQTLQFTQDSKFLGKHYITLAKQYLKIENKASGLVVLLKAGSKSAILYNRKLGKFMLQASPIFRNPYEDSFTAFYACSFNEIPIVQRPPSKLYDYTTQVFTEAPGFMKRQLCQFRKKELPGRTVAQFEFQTTDDFKSPPAFTQFVNRFFCLPKTAGYPLQLKYRTVAGNQEEFLGTSRPHSAQVSQSDFEVPAGLIAAKRIQEIYVDPSIEDAIRVF